jgi:orotate phosphoribosyltransferase
MKGIDTLVQKALEMKERGLNEHEIGRELHVSDNTVVWLLTRNVKGEKPPVDVKIGWRSIGVFGNRIGYLAAIYADIIGEEVKKNETSVDAIVGIAIQGIPLATCISEEMGIELAIYRPAGPEKEGTISSNFAGVEGKKVAVIDDVTGTGATMRAAIKHLRELGATPILALVIVNKNDQSDIDGVPLRSLIRARPISS